MTSRLFAPQLRSSRLRHVLLSTAMLAIAAVPAAAYAQATGPSAQTRAGEVQFNVPAQELDSALTRVADQGGIRIFFTSAELSGKRSNGVSGTMTVEQALSQVLSGTGFGWRYQEGRTVVIERLPDTQGAMQLGPVRVEGAQPAEAQVPSQALIGNLPPAFAGGQVARGGQVGILGNRDILDTPFSQTNYTHEFIEDQQAKSVGQVLQNDPSVSAPFPSAGGLEGYYVRGFYAGTPINISTDGTYGLYPTDTKIATEAIERVEILKGPSALLNGISPEGIVGGTINLVPKRAGPEPLTQFTVDYTSDANVGGHLDFGRRFGADQQFGLRFNGVYRGGDTAIDRQSEERELAALALDYRGRDVRLTGDFNYQRSKTNVARRPLRGVLAGVPIPSVPDNSANWAQPWERFETTTVNGKVRGEVDITQNLTLHASAAAGFAPSKNQFGFLYLINQRGDLAGNALAIPSYGTTASVEGGADAKAKTGFIDHKIVLSATRFWQTDHNDFGFASIRSNLYNPPVIAEPISFSRIRSPRDTLKGTQRNNSGVALADTMSMFDERVQLTAGLRWQRVDASSFDTDTGEETAHYSKDAVTPAVGIVVKPANGVSLYGNYIEGLSQGSVAPASAANANQIFAPYVTRQYEIGVKFDTGNLGFTFGAFDITQPNDYTDPVTNIFSGNGKQRNRGLELSIFGKLAESIRIVGGVAYLDAELAKTEGGLYQGNRAQGIPKFRTNLTGEWDTPFLIGLTVTASIATASSSYIDLANQQRVGGWRQVDLGARYTINPRDWKPIIVRAQVLNVADAKYWIPYGGQLGQSDPRTFQLSLTVGF